MDLVLKTNSKYVNSLDGKRKKKAENLNNGIRIHQPKKHKTNKRWQQLIKKTLTIKFKCVRVRL